MGATHSHVCRAHSLLNPAQYHPSPMQRLEISIDQSARKSEINVGRGIRTDLGQLLLPALAKSPQRVGIISNKRVFGLYGREVVRSLRRSGFKTSTWLMPEGERYKSFSILEKAV